MRDRRDAMIQTASGKGPGRGWLRGWIRVATLLAIGTGGPARALDAVPAPPTCRPARFAALMPPLANTPYVVLEAGGRTGPWLVDFGSTITSAYAQAWNTAAGEPVRISGLPLPGAAGTPRALPIVPGGRPRAGVGAPLGTLGTDLLKDVTTAIHFEAAADPHVIFGDPACDSEGPPGPGYVRTSQADFFSAHPETHAGRRPNVPVLFIELTERPTDPAQPRLAEPSRSARTWAQLDTGYADTYWPYAVDINEPYLALLKATVPSLVRTGLVPVAGCGQEDSLREVYVAPGWRLEIVPDPPQRAIRFESFHLVVKPRMSECGGIGPMPVPAAQLGASFLRAFGTTLFRPARAELWIKRPDLD